MTSATRSGRWSRIVFAAAFVCSALTAVVTVGFFVLGVADGSVSSANIGLWSALLAVVLASVLAGHALHARAQVGAAIVVLAVTAVPGIFAALFMLLAIVLHPRWN